jgi:hypothetical protein
MSVFSHSLPYPKQDPKLFERVSVTVKRPFCIGGQVQEVGAVVRIERHLAEGLQSLGKAELV